MKRDERAVLLEHRSLSRDTCLLTFASPFFAENVAPGQFTMVRLPDTEGLLLRRPYSFCDVDRDSGRFTLLVKEVGRGTRALARLPVGEEVSCLGPLGSAFRMPSPGRRPVVVAGGVGIAPFVGFCRVLRDAGLGATVLLGGRGEEDLYLREAFETLGMDVRAATEDGSFGHRGLVTALLEEALEDASPAELYSCGPTPMLLAVAEIAGARGIPHQVSLERRMGCGVGCCLGCVVYTSEYVRCCTEGPVFDAASIRWDRDPVPL